MDTLTIRRQLGAPPERVWRALTDPAALVAWLWPARLRTTAEVDLRPGGRYRIAAAEADMAVSGVYEEVSEPHRLVFSWRWDGEPDTTRVTIELTGQDGGCALLLVHEGFADTAGRDSNAQGWSDCLDRLPGWLTASTHLPR